MGAWVLIKHRASMWRDIQIRIRLQLRAAAIYSILDYGLSEIRIAVTMHGEIQQYASKCVRSIVEAAKRNAENPNSWGNGHESNGGI